MNYQMKIKQLLIEQERFKDSLSQPFTVGEQFTGMKGKYVPIKDTNKRL